MVVFSSEGFAAVLGMSLIQTAKVLVLLFIFISCQSNTGGSVMNLTSTLNGRQAFCPGEVVTYTCTVLHTGVISVFALPDIDGVHYFPRSPIGHQVIRAFQLALTDKVPDPNNAALADLTITLTVTATLAHNGTEVQCQGDDPSERMSQVLYTASQPPSPPQNPGYHVQHHGPHNVTVTVQWRYPEFDGGVPVNNYTISGTNIMTTTSQINETTLTLPYNIRQTIEVAATNCIGTSRTAMFTYFEAGCEEPIPPSRGSIDNFQSAAEGATITYSCSPGLVPSTQMSAVCTNMTWIPDPATLQCREPLPGEVADCGAPPPPVNGSVQPHTKTTEGSVVVFQCDRGFVPEGEMTAVCGRNGQWTPNPGGITCSPRPTQTFTPSQTFTEALILTPSATPDFTGPGSIPLPEMQLWLVPVVVVCSCVLVLSCVAIIIAGIVVVRKMKSRVNSKNLNASDCLEQQPSTLDKGPVMSQLQGEVFEAQYDVVQQISVQKVSHGLMYADLGPHVQAPVQPPSIGNDVQYSLLLHNQGEQVALDQADKSLNLDNLLIQLQHVDNTKWYQLGEALDVPKRRLNDITSHCSAEPDQCKIEMLDQWLRSHIRPTWREVADALTQIHESELANSLRKVYTTGILPITVDMRSLPQNTLVESPPPPLPPKQFSDDDPIPLLECHEPPQNTPSSKFSYEDPLLLFENPTQPLHPTPSREELQLIPLQGHPKPGQC